MVQEAEVPGTGVKIDWGDPPSILVAIVVLVGLFMVLFVSAAVGQNAANTLLGLFGRVLGMDPSGGSESIEVV